MTKRMRAHSWPPKGSYPLPGGGYGLDGIHVTKDGRRIRTTAHLKAEPDLKALAGALLEHAKHLDKERARRDRGKKP